MLLSKVVPKGLHQQRYVELLKGEKPYVVIGFGAAGSGKTMLATHIGVKKLKNGDIRKLVITRPTVSVGQDLGFLPGTLNEKMTPWLRPIYDILEHHYPKSKIDKMISDDIIELSSIAHMRGRTFEDSFVICDEAQNCTIPQTLMMLTRIGNNSKMVITGDPTQHDQPSNTINGLEDLVSRLDKTEYDEELVAKVEFDESDVIRHPVIPFILDLYK
jgi:phosphate starvation-inducible PhoH-like protein